LRFLTDYLNGSVYYKIEYPEQNLVRAKNQLCLLAIVNAHSNEIKTITHAIF